MGNPRRLSVKLGRDEAMRVTRVSIRGERLCYVIVADKRQRYKKGRSGIVYIGTTTKGVGRLASSAANRAPGSPRPSGRAAPSASEWCRVRQGSA